MQVGVANLTMSPSIFTGTTGVGITGMHHHGVGAGITGMVRHGAGDGIHGMALPGV